MQRSTPPFRADVVGSLLRPEKLKAAREQLLGEQSAGENLGPHSNAALRAVEDECILEAIAMQLRSEIESASNPLPVDPAPPLGAKKKGDSVAKDLDFLFGDRPDEESEVEKHERRFWALLRIMQRKGLLTRDEFLAELEREN